MKYIATIRQPPAQDLAGLVYQQIKQDFGVIADPFRLHAAIPEALAGMWSVTRETEITGQVAWPIKEAVAAAVSQINACPYCVDIHSALVDARASQPLTALIKEGRTAEIADLTVRGIVAWALATRSPRRELLLTPPFTAEEAPEIIGIAVAYHYINRMVHVFLPDSLLPPLLQGGWIRGRVWRAVGRRLARDRDRAKSEGASLRFLPEGALPVEMSWAARSPTISRAFAGWTAAVERMGAELLSIPVRSVVSEVVGAWRGEAPPLGRAWVTEAVAGLPTEADRAAGALALLSALAPYQVDGQVIEAFRAHYATDAHLVGTVAWASFAAARRISSWLRAPGAGEKLEPEQPAGQGAMHVRS